MESKAKLFSEQEKLFKERTGKDFTTLYQKYVMTLKKQRTYLLTHL
jgi:hypothetical protein